MKGLEMKETASSTDMEVEKKDLVVSASFPIEENDRRGFCKY